jgi:hypothetical protein
MKFGSSLQRPVYNKNSLSKDFKIETGAIRTFGRTDSLLTWASLKSTNWYARVRGF